jgi:hypothetical protein
VGRALEDLPADDGRDGDHRRVRFAHRGGDAGRVEDRTDRDDGVRGADDDRARVTEGVEHLRGGPGRLDALELDSVDRALGALADHELLEGDPAAAREDAGADRLVAHRQDAGREPERSRQLADRGGQRGALAQALGPSQPDRQVAVAEVEPHLDAELAQLVHRVEGVVAQAPAAVVDAVGQPERAEVGIGRDVRAVDLDVVGGVGDDDEILANDVEHPAGELRAPASAGQHDHHHRPVILIPACVLWRTLIEISSAVRDSVIRAISKRPTSTQRRPSMRSISAIARSLSSRRSPHTSTSSSSA